MLVVLDQEPLEEHIVPAPKNTIAPETTPYQRSWINLVLWLQGVGKEKAFIFHRRNKQHCKKYAIFIIGEVFQYLGNDV